MLPLERKAVVFEKHFTLAELAKIWHLSRNTVAAWFMHEPGVIRYGVAAKLKKGRKRTYVSLRVPEHVARRVYHRHTGKDSDGE